MRKLFVSVIVFIAFCASASSQEAFKHLSAGVDVGTTGVGLELALPVVTDHLVIKAGGNLPNFSASATATYDMSSFSSRINEYVVQANNYLTQVHGETTQFAQLPNNTLVEASARIYFASFRAILEYYPSKNSGFHISAGVYVGSNQVLAADGCAVDLWNSYSIDKAISDEMCSKYDDFEEIVGGIPDLAANINGKTYQIKDPGNVNLGLSVWKARPYFGIGFGKSVPDTRCGFQFDLGAIYLGRPSFTSTNEVAYQPDLPSLNFDNSGINAVMNTMAKYAFWPVVNFRFILRIF